MVDARRIVESQMPIELEEAAYAGGATRFVLVSCVFMPLIAPALVIAGLLAFIGAEGAQDASTAAMSGPFPIVSRSVV